MYPGMDYIFKPLLKLSGRTFRWFSKLSGREEFRQKVQIGMANLNKRLEEERAREQARAEREKEHQEWLADMDRVSAQRRKEHQEHMAKTDREIVQIRRNAQEHMAEMERASAQRRIESQERQERMAEWDRGHEERMAEIAREREETARERQEIARDAERWEQGRPERERQLNEELQETRERYREIGRSIMRTLREGLTRLRTETHSTTQRRLRELEPTIHRLKGMIAMAYIAEQKGLSTAVRISKLLSEHDRIATRNGLRREGFSNYTYSFLQDRRRNSGPEPADVVQTPPDTRIISATTCGA